MFIKQKRVVNVEKYLSHLTDGQCFVLSVTVDETVRKKLPSLGWPHEPQNGDTVLPAVRGPVSRLNAEGGFVLRKDLPREERYIRTVMWKWTEWHGKSSHEREEERDIYRSCYRRDMIPPPAHELEYVTADNTSRIVSKFFTKSNPSMGDIRHGINLMLELFGECELLTSDLSSALPDIKVQRVNWSMLPPGKYPWSRLNEHLDKLLAKRSPSDRIIVKGRADFLTNLGPSVIHTGMGGFSEYVAYEFTDKGLVALECIKQGNAIYIFGMDWARVAKLTKAEVLIGNLSKLRIVHAKGWRERLVSALKSLGKKEPEPAI
jgi:hypothetical protein